MLALKNVNKQSMIDYEDLLFMLIENGEKRDWSQLYYVDAVVINCGDKHIVESTIQGIRQHHNPNVYLKPIFITGNKGIPKQLIQCCDGKTDLTHYDHIAERARSINKQIDRIFQLQRFPSPEMERLYKLLQYLYTREKALDPIADRHAKLKYHYPLLSWQYQDDDIHKLIEAINLGKKNGYLSTEVHDKIHLCSSCNSAHHTIRETCRECNSIDLETEDLIHHFQCAYIGPESDFKNEDDDQLVCPKCDKTIRHIGIDYDKPSHIYNCKTCEASFQQATFTSHCTDCADVKDIRYLKEESIERLHLTSRGTELVVRGLPRAGEKAPQTLNNSVTGIYSYEVFQHLLRQEEVRTKKKGRTSIYGNIRIIDDSLNLMTENESVKLQNELAVVLKSYITDADMISPRSPSEYHFLLTDSSAKVANKLKDAIEYNFKELLVGNIAGSKPEILVELMMLGGQNSPAKATFTN